LIDNQEGKGILRGCALSGNRSAVETLLVPMDLTPFESEILDSILLQVEGFKIGSVTQRATTRILRATIRRIQPRLIARSKAADADNDREVDHAIPVHVLCGRILDTPNLDRTKLETILNEWLVTVELTASEHSEVLQKCGLASRMPPDWDGADPLAHYRAAGITLLEMRAGGRLTDNAEF